MSCDLILSFVSFATVPRRKPFFWSRVFVPKEKQKIKLNALLHEQIRYLGIVLSIFCSKCNASCPKKCPITTSTLTVHNVRCSTTIGITVLDKIKLFHLRHVYEKQQIDQTTQCQGVLFSWGAFQPRGMSFTIFYSTP